MQKIGLDVVNEHAAGIDIGSKSHFVAINQDPNSVKEFGVYTKDNDALITHLKNAGITTVAIESTGSYWQTLFAALQAAGFDVLLVSGAQTKNVKGRKTDVIDCMWIQKLHSLGLLSGCFLASDGILVLRTLTRHRFHLVEQMASYLNKMKKELRLMNIRLDIAIRDIAGKTGMAILEAIFSGERDPQALAKLADPRVKKSHAELVDSLQGQWREENLILLQSDYAIYKMFRLELDKLDLQIEGCINSTLVPSNKDEKNATGDTKVKTKHRKGKNGPKFDIRTSASSYFGVDLGEIEGVGDNTIFVLLTCLGLDISKFSSAKAFSAWLRVAPNNKVSGGRIISSNVPKGSNEIAIALKNAANAIGNSKSDFFLRTFFHKIAFKKGRMAAITATAHKLAIIIWNMVTRQIPYKINELEVNIIKQKKRAIKQIENKVAKCKMTQQEVQELFARCSVLAN